MTLEHFEAQRRVRWIIALSALAHMMTAYFSRGYHQLDEHFQILEFANYKLGGTSAQDLAWEFAARLRPWLQPAGAFGLIKVLKTFRVESPFAWALGCRIVAASLGFVAQLGLLACAKKYFTNHHTVVTAAFLLSLAWFIPYLHVRPSSESLSSSLFFIGFAIAELRLRIFRQTSFWALCAGLLMGLAFECRFQTGLMIAGFAAWSCIHRKFTGKECALFICAVAATFALGRMVDFWGYQEWTCTPWNYLRRNLFEGEANRHGTSPWWQYFAFMAQTFPPLSFILGVGAVVGALRHYNHVLSWTCLPYFVVHLILSHKEPRFLFPLAVVSPLLLLLALPERTWMRLFKTHVFALRSLVVLNIAALFAMGLRPAKSEISLYRFAYRHLPHNTDYAFVGRNPFQLADKIPRFYTPTLGQGYPLAEFRSKNLASGSYYLAVDGFKEIVTSDGLKNCVQVYTDLPSWATTPASLKALERTKFRPRAVYQCK